MLGAVVARVTNCKHSKNNRNPLKQFPSSAGIFECCACDYLMSGHRFASCAARGDGGSPFFESGGRENLPPDSFLPLLGLGCGLVRQSSKCSLGHFSRTFGIWVDSVR